MAVIVFFESNAFKRIGGVLFLCGSWAMLRVSAFAALISSSLALEALCPGKPNAPYQSDNNHVFHSPANAVSNTSYTSDGEEVSVD